jgi:serine/threonine-protein kinase
MAPRWRLRTLGGSSLLRDGVAVSGAAAQRRRIALLGILAVAGEAGVSRDKLLALLWPESDTDSARHALSQLLFLVRRDLQDVQLLTGGSELRLSTDQLMSDVAELEQAIAADDDASVVDVYTGPFLDGFHLRDAPEFERWQEEQRSRFAKAYTQSLERLALAAESSGDKLASAAHWRRLAIADPLNSRVALAFMRSLVATGDVSGALHHARLHEALLSEEVGVAPDASIAPFISELRKRASAPTMAARASSEDAEALGAKRDSAAGTSLATPERRQPLSRRWHLAGIATLVVLIAGTALVASSHASVHLDQRLVAVAPFEVLDPQLAIWREGMMDVLSRTLDGAGPLRSVPPSTVVRQWSGLSDVASSVALGRKTGASLVVLGSLLRSGRDSVRATTTLINVASSEILAEREARDDIEHIDRLGDTLAIHLLGDIGVRQPVAAVRGAALGAASLPALKAFLRGEQLYRRGDLDSAYAQYKRAVAIDSNFALAFHMLSRAGWSGQPDMIDSAHHRYAIRAQRLNHKLPRRDSLLILLDSLRTVPETNPFYGAPSIAVRQGQRMLAIARQAADEYRMDAEAQYQLGELLDHYAVVLGTTANEARAAFDRALAADSGFAPAYDHVISLALTEQDTAGARRYLRAMNDHAASVPVARARVVLALALNGRLGSDTAGTFTTLDSLPYEPIALAIGPTSLWMDSLETAVHLLRYIIARERREMADVVPFMVDALVLNLAERGHLKDAYAVYLNGAAEHHRLFTELALLGSVPVLEAARTFRRWTADSDLVELSRAAPWWAQHGDTQSLNMLSARARRQPIAGDSMGIGPYVEWTAKLYGALARSDTIGAVRACDATTDESLPLRFLEDVHCGQLLIARGRYRDAEQRLTPTLADLGPIQLVVRTLEWAHAAERAGDRANADKGYAFVRAAWRRPDAALAPRVR